MSCVWRRNGLVACLSRRENKHTEPTGNKIDPVNRVRSIRMQTEQEKKEESQSRGLSQDLNRYTVIVR